MTRARDRRWNSILVFGLLAAVSFGDEFRIFTDTQGRAIEAKVLSYDPVQGQVEIERKDGKRVWVSPRLFSEDDQRYVKDWVAAYRVLSEECLRISFDKQKIDSFKQGMTDDQSDRPMKGDIVSFEVSLQNRSKKPIEGLKIEYRYFINVIGSGQAADLLKTTPVVQYTVRHIDPSDRASFTTEELRIETHYNKIPVWANATGGISGFEYEKQTEDDLLGIWLKIYGPEVDGEAAVREICFPEDLSENYKWDD